MVIHCTLLVGPLPPPVDGRAVATEWLMNELSARGCAVDVVDTQLPTGPLRAIRKLARCFRAAAQILGGPQRCLLLVASHRWGLLAEMGPLIAARIRRSKVYMAHHSSSYVTARSMLMAGAVRIGGPGLHHIFLCEPMQKEFFTRYGTPDAEAIVLDNAALVPGDHDPSILRSRSLVHISNLSHAKGSSIAIDVARALRAPLVLGGPAAPDVEGSISAGLRRGLALRHLGPVGRDVKMVELSRARVFVLPSRAEAQPLVIYEAAAAGSIPVVWDVGWVRDQMDKLGLGRFVFPPGDREGLSAAVGELLAMTTSDFQDVSERTIARFRELRDAASASVDGLACGLQSPWTEDRS